MSDEVDLGGKIYISSKRASELSGYAQDYIGQLARAGTIDASRIGGLWYVYEPSLNSYKSKAENYRPDRPLNAVQQNPESLITFDGKDYISASRAAKMTGYHQDYVGQLARSGTILARQVGNRWYVDRDAISLHKQEKDAMLAALQAQSVGIERVDEKSVAIDEPIPPSDDMMVYKAESKALLPALPEIKEKPAVRKDEFEQHEIQTQVPIRVVRTERYRQDFEKQKFEGMRKTTVRTSGKTMFYLKIMGITVMAVILLGGGAFAMRDKHLPHVGNIAAALPAAFNSAANLFENAMAHELIYQRQTNTQP
jgi:hypothetical protein